MINLIYVTQFDTNGILTALYIVIMYIQTYYMHICMDIQEHSYIYMWETMMFGLLCCISFRKKCCLNAFANNMKEHQSTGLSVHLYLLEAIMEIYFFIC